MIFFLKRINQDSNVPSARRLLPEKSVGETEINPLEQRKMNSVSEKKVVILNRICKKKIAPSYTYSMEFEYLIYPNDLC